jgi:excisionase family DNA binding protein
MVVVTSTDELQKIVREAVREAVMEVLQFANNQKSEDDGYMNKQEAAAYLRCSTTAIDSYRRNGFIKVHRVAGNKKVLFKKSELKKLG